MALDVEHIWYKMASTPLRSFPGKPLSMTVTDGRPPVPKQHHPRKHKPRNVQDCKHLGGKKPPPCYKSHPPHSDFNKALALFRRTRLQNQSASTKIGALPPRMDALAGAQEPAGRMGGTPLQWLDKHPHRVAGPCITAFQQNESKGDAPTGSESQQ